LLYSTSPKEVAALKALRESGMSIAEAINHYIAMERGEPAPARVSGAKSAARGGGGDLGRAATGR
jgi:hypothetical protein